MVIKKVYTCNIYLQSAERAMLVDVTLVFMYRHSKSIYIARKALNIQFDVSKYWLTTSRSNGTIITSGG